MKKFFLFSAILISACGSSMKISSDYDKMTDFTRYHTYEFTPDAQAMPIEAINRDRLISAVSHELEARGFTQSTPGDLLVDLNVKLQQHTDLTGTATPVYGAYDTYGNYGPYGNPWSYGYGPGYTDTQVAYDDYVEGTLFINLVDNKAQQIVWQGRGTKALAEDITPEQRELNIKLAVESIFYKYPVKPLKKK